MSYLQTISRGWHAQQSDSELELLLWPSSRRVRVLTDAQISFGTIPNEHWHQPEWIDENVAAAARRKMELQRIIYAG